MQEIVEIVQKLVEVEKNIAAQKGNFNFFALFLREDAPDVWDLLVSAPWISQDRGNALKVLSNEIQKSLKGDELKMLSRIVIIEEGNPGLVSFQNSLSVEHSKMEIRNSTFSGLLIKHAYFITCRVEKTPSKNVAQA